MAFEARLVRGKPRMIDYTPGSNVAAGAVVVLNDINVIAHNDIAASTLGAVAIGGGEYEMPKSTAGSSAIAAGKKVYWDDSANVITTNSNSGANKQIGFTTAASVDADATQLVQHAPG